jgi:hypothetical protein
MRNRQAGAAAAETMKSDLTGTDDSGQEFGRAPWGPIGAEGVDVSRWFVAAAPPKLTHGG